MVSVIYLSISLISFYFLYKNIKVNSSNKQRVVNIVCLAAFWPLIPLKYAQEELKELIK
jgi:hypothetical protein